MRTEFAETYFAAQCAAFHPGVRAILTHGYSESGDGGEGHYGAVSTEPLHPAKFQTADGRWWELMEKTPNVLQFGGTDDGLASDDTHALNGMAVYCNLKRRSGHLPATERGFSTSGGHSFLYGFTGGGRWASKLFITSATGDIITGSDKLGGNYEGVYYFASTYRMSGATIVIDSTEGDSNLGVSITNNVFQNDWIAIALKRSTCCSIERNICLDFGKHFVEVKNIDFPDNGDHSIVGNVWDTSKATASAGIMQYSAGGCRIINNKGGRGAFGFQLNLIGPKSHSTSVLVIGLNSFEAQTVGQIRLGRAPGSKAEFLHVVINGNEFAGAPAGNAALELDSGDPFICNVNVTGNVIQFTGTAISASTAQGLNICGNTLQSFWGGSVGIQTSGYACGRVTGNMFVAVTTPHANTSPHVTVM